MNAGRAAGTLAPPTVGRLRSWPSRDRLAWIDRRFAVYIVGLGIANGLFSIAAKIGWDFDIFWEAAKHAASGQSAYTTTLALGADRWGPGGRTFVSPPFLAYVLAPFTWLPEPVVYGLWSALGVAALYLALRAIAPPATAWRMPRLLAGLGVLWISFFLGQVNLFVLAGLLLTLGSRDDRLAGLGLAGAVVLRMTPAVFVIALLFDRRWRALGWALGLFTIGAVVAGGWEWPTYLDITRTLVALPPVDSIWQSSPADIARWLPYVAAAAVGLVVLGAGRLGGETRLVRGTALGLSLVLCLATAWFHWYAFALAAIYVDGDRTLWGRRALLAFLVISWLPVPLGSWGVEIAGSLLLAYFVCLVASAYLPGHIRRLTTAVETG